MIKKFLIILMTTGVLMANSLPQYKTKTLANGLQIVVIPMKNNSNVVSTNIFYKVGSGHEIMGKSGIAHMLEHLNFKSTDNLKAGEFDKIVKGFGGVNNASTGFDYTHYYIKSSSKNMDKSLELFADLMANLKLKDEEFQPERDVVLEERRWRTDNSPIGYLYFKLFNSAFIYNSYHWTPIGFMEDIKHWTIDDIKEFHSNYYQPSNAIVVVAGDITSKEVFDTTTKYFGKIKSKKILFPSSHLKEPEQDGAKRVYLKKDTEVEMIAIAYKIPNFLHADQPALHGLSELLSSGKSSLLQKVLVNDKKMVNQISGFTMDSKNPSVFIFLAVGNPGIKAKDIEKEILSIIENIKKGNVKTSEIEKIKINTKADFIFSLENSSDLASLFGSYYAKGDITPLLNYEKNINELTKENIIQVAKKYLKKERSTTVILKKEHSG